MQTPELLQCPVNNPQFLTLDIETLGLLHHLPLPPITCVCLYDGTIKYQLILYNIPEDKYHQNAVQLLNLLDTAPQLAGFNAVRFDLPYIAQQLQVTKQRLSAWISKCIDPFMGMLTVLRQTCKLQRLLDLNNLGSKTGTGSDAIGLAKAGKMKELLDYCMMDVLLTHELCCLETIRTGDTQGLHLNRSTWTWESRHFEPEKAPTMEEALLAFTPDTVLFETADFEYMEDC